MTKFTPARGGHAPGHLRDMFATYAEDGAVPVDQLFHPDVIGDRDPITWLLGQLWNCTDQLPSDVRRDVALNLLPDEEVYTYAQAVRKIKANSVTSGRSDSQWREAEARTARMRADFQRRMDVRQTQLAETIREITESGQKNRHTDREAAELQARLARMQGRDGDASP